MPRGSRLRISVSPSQVFTIAPLLRISVNGGGSRSKIGRAKSYRRPVASATSTPAAMARAMASRFASGICPLLSRMVPSMSRARRRIMQEKGTREPLYPGPPCPLVLRLSSSSLELDPQLADDLAFGDVAEDVLLHVLVAQVRRLD